VSDLAPPRVVLLRRIVLSGDGHLDHAFEQNALAAEGEIDRLGGDVGLLGTAAMVVPALPTVDEQAKGGLQSPASGLASLISSQRRVVPRRRAPPEGDGRALPSFYAPHPLDRDDDAPALASGRASVRRG
jgi:hypothetical protein